MSQFNHHIYDTLQEALNGLNDRGFTEEFHFKNRKMVARSTGRSYEATEISIVEHHRFEGISNPDDMSVIYAFETSEGIRGIFLDAFGLYSDHSTAEYLRKVTLAE